MTSSQLRLLAGPGIILALVGAIYLGLGNPLAILVGGIIFTASVVMLAFAFVPRAKTLAHD